MAALEKILGSLKDISYTNIEDILDMAAAGSGENKWLNPIASAMVFKIGEDIHLADTGFVHDMDPEIRSYIRERSDTEQKEEADPPGQEIKIGGDTDLEDFPFFVRARRLSDPGDLQ